MKRLIKRYVLKAQTDSENDEINEGKPNKTLTTAPLRQGAFVSVLSTHDVLDDRFHPLHV